MAQTDLALSFHRVSDRVYELSGLRTGSVRDQMLRAVLVVERLAEVGDISSVPGCGLLLIGGGAAGVAAALRASEKKIPVVLLERNSGVLNTQLPVTSRIIDPTEYDWPHPHWDKSVFPHRTADQSLPLEFERGAAADVAGDWALDFHNRCTAAAAGSGDGHITVEYHCTVEKDPSTTLYKVRRNDPVAPKPDARLTWGASAVQLEDWDPAGSAKQFGAVISCVGFGDEEVSVTAQSGHDYRGIGFWTEDKLNEATLGTKAKGKVRALVSGSGDGAQQDFQRILTRRCGKDLYEAIAKVDTGFDKSICTANLAFADDDGRRAHAWQSPKTMPREALRRWHQAYVEEVDALWRRWTAASQLDSLAAALLRDKVNVSATWLLRHEAPSYSFGLNRLLTLIVARLHARATGREWIGSTFDSVKGSGSAILIEQSIAHVCGSGHSCGPAPASCHEEPHDVYLKATPDPKLLGKFDLIIIRHGMRVKPLFAAPPVPEQHVPFSFPR